QAQTHLQSAERGLSRLIGLINDLLDVEKMEAGKFSLQVEPVKLSKVVDRSLDAMGGYAQNEDISLTNCVTRELGESEILADSDRLVQVIVNLISNAVKFSPKGSTVSLSAAQVNGWTEIRVTDKGIGIPEEFQKSIFNRFEQLALPDALRNNSSGLGLAIC